MNNKNKHGRRGRGTKLCVLAALVFCLLLGARPASAEGLMPALTGQGHAGAAADTADPTDRVARLSDTEVRELLLRELEAKQAQQTARTAGWREMLAGLEQATHQLLVHFSRVLADTRHMLRDTGSTLDAYTARSNVSTERFWLLVALMLLLPMVAERLVARHLWPERRPHAPVPPKQRLRATWAIMRHRLLLGGLALLASYGLGRWLLRFDPVVMEGFHLAFGGVLVIRISRWSSQFFQLPDVPEARLTPISTHWARFMVRQTTLIGVIGAVAYMTYQFRIAIGMPEAAVTVGFWFLSGLFAVIIYSIWRGRSAFAEMIAAGHADPSLAWQRLAVVWPWVAIVLSIGEWLVVQYYAATGRSDDLTIGAIFLTLMIILFLPPMLNSAQPLVAWLLPINDDTGDAVRARRLAARPPVEQIARVIMLVLIGIGLAALWGTDPVSLLSEQLGSGSTRLVVELFQLLAGAFLLWQLFDIWLARLAAGDRLNAGPVDHHEPGEMGGPGGTRLATVLPLFRHAGHALIGLTALMMALYTLGVNIAPLIAGAGVIGLAVGFGAQALVRDVVSGLFFLIDDAFRIGEYVDIGGTVGTVEKISIRSLRLRHHRGPLHTVPYGEISKLTNYSRDWVIVKLKFRVPFDTDIEQVRKIFKKIGQDLLADPELGPDFIQPFKSQGVFDVDDSALIIRGKFMAKPGKQFLIQRAIYVAVQRAFEANGIAFARRSVIVQVAGDDGVADPDSEARRRQLALAAAEQALAENQQADDDISADDKPLG